MKTSSLQLFRNPDVKPTEETIKEALKDANKAYTQFVKKLEIHQIQLEWRYYPDGKAWLGKGLNQWVGVRGGHKVQTVFWLSVWEGFFKVIIYLPEKARVDALNLPVVPEIRERIAHANTLGKLQSFPVVFELQTEEEFDGLFAVVELKKILKK